MATRTYCDRCKKDLEGERLQIVFAGADGNHTYVDLCPGCREDLIAWIEDWS